MRTQTLKDVQYQQDRNVLAHKAIWDSREPQYLASTHCLQGKLYCEYFRY